MKRIKLLATVAYYYPSKYVNIRESARMLAPSIFVYNNHSLMRYILVKEYNHTKVFLDSYPMNSFLKVQKQRKEKTNTFPIIGGYLELTKSIKEFLNKKPLEVLDEYLMGEILIKKAYYYGNINKILEYVRTEDEYRSQSKP